MFLGVDVGKTNLRVGLFDHELRLLERWSTAAVDAQAAQEALRTRLEVLSDECAISAAGISTFGPLSTDPAAATYGEIHESSDPAWSGVNIPALVRAVLGVPVYFDYDVNAGALAEAELGAAKHLRRFVYLSIGTGVGGVMFREGLTPGYAPQMGHMYLPREADDTDFAGSCRFHGACLQGLASGRALRTRWGEAPESLGLSHPAWDLEARYVARACANLIYTFSPQKIVLGSSVGTVPHLAERANGYLRPLLNGFLEPELQATYATEDPITRATLTTDSSLYGAAAVAKAQTGMPWVHR